MTDCVSILLSSPYPKPSKQQTSGLPMLCIVILVGRFTQSLPNNKLRLLFGFFRSRQLTQASL
jgi:hypothetical protein